MKKLIHIAIASLLTAVMVTGCGWHLRGSGQVASNISSVHISGQDKKGRFYRSLSRSLQANDITITDSTAEAQFNIITLNQRSTRRTATVSSGARVSEYQLTELVDVIIIAADGTQLLPKTTLSTERFFDFDENDVQSKNEEAELLKREMLDDLVRQIIRRLSAVSNHSHASESTPAEDATES
jgi:LPS-assembly lipoprotein